MVGQTLCHVLFVCLVSSSLGLAANVVQGRDPAAADPPAVEAAGAELSAQSKAGIHCLMEKRLAVGNRQRLAGRER